MTLRDLCAAYVEGYIQASLSNCLIHGKIKSEELDDIKELAMKCMENYIAHLNLTAMEKEEMKQNYKQWSDFALQGIKQQLRDSGKM